MLIYAPKYGHVSTERLASDIILSGLEYNLFFNANIFSMMKKTLASDSDCAHECYENNDKFDLN